MIPRKDFQLFSSVLECCGVSGYTYDTAKVYLEYAKSLGHECGIDSLGSVSAFLPASIENTVKPRNIIISAHLDTVGFIVSSVEDDGSLSLSIVGDIIPPADGFPATLKTRNKNFRVIIREEKDSKDEEIFNYKAISYFKTKEEAEKAITIGDPVFFYQALEKVGPDFLVSSNFDNKAGLFCLMKLLHFFGKEKSKNNIFFVAPSFEEIGAQGAIAATTKINPLIFINIDITPVEEHNRLGTGPVISVGSVLNRQLIDEAIKQAKKLGIQYTLEACGNETCTDADMIAALKGGIPAFAINIPCYKHHSLLSMVSWGDVENTILLTKTLISESIPQMVDFIPRF